jgi:hypothetical protein
MLKLDFEPLKALPSSDQLRRYYHLSRWTDTDDDDNRVKKNVWRPFYRTIVRQRNQTPSYSVEVV